MIFKGPLVPFHSHTLPYHNEVTEDTQGQDRDIILLKEKGIIVLLLQHSPQSQAWLLTINSAKQGFEREITRKGMKGMELLMVTCSPSDLHCFQSREQSVKSGKVTKYIVTPVSSFHGEY